MKKYLMILPILAFVGMIIFNINYEIDQKEYTMSEPKVAMMSEPGGGGW
ncbi:hypothetical protein P4W10_16070 [Bacillus thuringiensis]|nr:hypothetical protein [Bacillus thuringiensis]MEC3484723.1 hypothetical protein [Bacillus thuringiensis]MED2067894.1 hypothetical protein [Bacillus thuringiensis]MED2191757.1 hypothetical protein [Bacillus thuringiensis]MED2213161.1 hypothetical protein [Bacillus thuringiensis]MED2223431.1 hypothetical protein [Bacillus thuringiensis]